MPRLLVFAACERVIIDQATQSVSLIGLFHDLQIGLPAEDVPGDAVIPIRWAVFAEWLRDEGDEGETFTQESDFRSPDGKRLASASAQFNLDKKMHRQTMNMPAFPLAGGGQYSVALFLRKGDGERREVATWPITVAIRSEPSPKG